MSVAANLNERASQVQAVAWIDDGLRILDQRVLPETRVYHLVTTVDQVIEAIKSMQVRGAPAIGIAAAFGVVLAARQRYSADPQHWKTALQVDLQQLALARPTAVNLHWALHQMIPLLDTITGNPESVLLPVAQQLHQQDIDNNRISAALGAELLQGASAVLTHCNAGALATGGYGTALGVIRSAYKQGLQTVYATETRPWSQGARLTVWELQEDGIPATLIADLAAGYLMQQNKIQWLIVGADRISANGDVANKIGTYALACLAHQHQVKVMVVAPTGTIDWTLSNGSDIPIENRSATELLAECYRQDDSLVSAWNPVFDVTPAALIDAIVTEKGVVEQPDIISMSALK